jgi:hypothetical protein
MGFSRVSKATFGLYPAGVLNDDDVCMCGSRPELRGGETNPLLLALESSTGVIAGDGKSLPLVISPSIKAGAEATPAVIVAAEPERFRSWSGAADGRVGLDGLEE